MSRLILQAFEHNKSVVKLHLFKCLLLVRTFKVLTNQVIKLDKNWSFLARQCSLVIRGFIICDSLPERIYRELRRPPVLWFSSMRWCSRHPCNANQLSYSTTNPLCTSIYSTDTTVVQYEKQSSHTILFDNNFSGFSRIDWCFPSLLFLFNHEQILNELGSWIKLF